MARFTDKYGQRLNEPVMLGYLAHLHLDARYVTEYWPTVMAFYGCTGEPEYRKAHIAEVEIKRLQKCVPVSQFFSVDYYYGDYTKLNGYFIHKYHLRVPKWQSIPMSPPEEVNLQDMQMICRELDHLKEECPCPATRREYRSLNLDHWSGLWQPRRRNFVIATFND